MPVITFEGGPLDTETKKELIQQLTATAVDITNIPAPMFTFIIREQPSDNLGIGGETVTDIKFRIQKEKEQSNG